MYLYVIQADNGLCKIGISKDVETRLHGIRANSPVGVRLLFCIHTPDINQMERDLHTRFSDKCDHAEWYRLSGDDIEYIRKQGESISIDPNNDGIKEFRDLLGRIRYSAACPNCSGRSLAKHSKGKVFINCKYCGCKTDLPIKGGQ